MSLRRLESHKWNEMPSSSGARKWDANSQNDVRTMVQVNLVLALQSKINQINNALCLNVG